MKKRPYRQPGRLAHVIAAIEVLSVRPWAGIAIDDWVSEVEVPEKREDSQIPQDMFEGANKRWTALFREHPEFFKLYDLRNEKDPKIEHKVILRLRAAFPINYNVKTGLPVPAEKLPADEQLYKEYTRRPLKESEIGILIKTAIDLHAREFAEWRESRFYLPAALALMGAALGELWRLFGSKLLHLLGLS